MTAIVAVPHGGCVPFIEPRHCDKLAHKAGVELANKLQDKGFTTFLFVGDEKRWEVDNNRKEGRQTDFRKRLRATLKSSRGPVFVVEVHSFPEKKLGSMNVYQLDTSPRTQLSLALQPLVPFFEGSMVNDISAEIKTDFPKVEHVLLEFFEQLTADDLNEMTEKIASKISSAAWSFNF